MNGQAPTAVDNAGNVYVTGSFTQAFSFGNTNLDPIATSAYLGKYDANGNALWAVALKGAATITAITTDEQNNVYIAGTLADAVEVGSTDNNVKTINGKEGEVENQVSSFILAYDANGVLKANKVIWSDIEDNMTVDNYWGEVASTTINHMAVLDTKLYASTVYTGHLTIDNIKWNGSYTDYGGAYVDATSGGVFAVNAVTLDNAETVANICVTDQYAFGYDCMNDIALTTDGESIYMAFLGNGNLTYTKADGTSEKLSFGYTDEGDTNSA